MAHARPLLPLPRALGHLATLQGARACQEDRAHSPHANVFCVHDGHAGSGAVERLVGVMEHDIRWASVFDGSPTPEAILQFLIDVYAHAGRALAEEASGVVTLTGVRTPAGVFLAWVGDCQGGVFSMTAGTGLLAVTGVLDVDEAEARLLVDRGEGVPRVHHDIRRPIENTPHTLLAHPPPIVQLADSSHTLCLADGGAQESYCAMTTPHVAFLNAGAQKEWVLAQQRHGKQQKTELHADIVFLRLGASQLFTDARIAECTQPTRSLGDAGAPQRPLPYAQALFAPLPPEKAGLRLLLTSDGVFSNGAFVNLDALARCVQDPLLFVRTQFYRRGQELTERLRLAGLLEPAQRALTPATWAAFLRFLDNHHLPAMHHAALSATYLSVPDEVHRWRVAAHDASLWLHVHTADAACTRGGDAHLHMHVAARLAVLMGSTDNVTLLLS